MAALTAEQLLKPHMPEPVAVPCPELGGDVYIRVMPGDRKILFDAFMHGKREEDGDAYVKWFRTAVIAAASCNERGEFLFERVDDATVTALAKQSAVVIQRIADEAADINLIGGKRREDLAKNSGVTQKPASG